MDTTTEAPLGNWGSDLLRRHKDAQFLQKFLIRRYTDRQRAGLPTSYVLNLNSAWGQGKTFFLERFAKDLSEQYVVATVNAWRDDYADDPLLSVMAAIDDTVQQDAKVKATAKKIGKQLGLITGQVVAAATKGAIKQTAQRVLGEGAEEIIALLRSAGTVNEVSKTVDKMWDDGSKAILDKFKNAQKTVQHFKSCLKSFVEELQKRTPGPMFVLIDELDRCRPTYAVALLERVKHLFDVDGVIFVIATDTDQLQHAVGAVYGAGFDSKRYLNRFFDSAYTFQNASYRDFAAASLDALPIAKDKLILPHNTILEGFIADGFDYCGLGLRDIQQACALFEAVVTVWDQKSPLVPIVLLPLIMGHVLGFPIALTDGYLKPLEERHSLVGRSSGWNVTFQTGHSGQVPEIVSVMNVFRHLCVLVSEPYRTLANRKPTPKSEQWCLDLVLREFEVLQRPSHSTIRNYPILVRTAGHLQAL